MYNKLPQWVYRENQTIKFKLIRSSYDRKKNNKFLSMHHIKFTHILLFGVPYYMCYTYQIIFIIIKVKQTKC